MQRMNIAVFIVIVSAVLLCPTALLFAATPTQTPTPTTSVALPTGAIIITNGLINERIAPPPQDALPNSPTATISGVPTPPPEYKATVPEVKVDATNFNIPKLDEVADWLTNVTRFMSAKQVKDNVTPHQDNLYISGQARRCITVVGFNIPDQIGDKYKTALVGYLPKLITATGLLSAQTVRNTVPLTDGKYNFEGPSYEVDAAPPCDTAGGVGTLQEPKQIVLAQGQGNKFIEWIKSLFEKFTVKTVFISKQLCPECERIHCQLTGCVKGSADLAYIGDDKKQKTIKESGGIADAFRTVNMDATKGESPNGQEENFTKTNTAYTKQMENSADLIKCSLVPPAQRAKLGLTGKCSGFVTPITSCGTTLPDLAITDSSCKLCSPGDIANINPTFFPNGQIPQTMIKILEKIGESYHVPPKMLLLTLFAEGGHPQYLQGAQWTEENVQKWSMCGEPMPFCDPNTATAMLPFGIRPEVFATYKTAVSDIFPERKGKETPCNFMDQAFAAGKLLSENMNTKIPTTISGVSGGTCLGVSVSELAKTRQATSCNWNQLDMYRGRLMYLRYCPETGKTNGYSANDQTLNWSKMFSNSFTCQ
jgi:hypothetical protein